MKNKKNNNNNNYKELYGDFTCPGCGGLLATAIIYDSGNGFCQECSRPLIS
ncbi:hypothetical protein [Clostridium perfringens]|uniref:hypothetical protein n=1 Tax=Clostridium perfringens TaxID=1502 RepID=UPI001CB0112D|nr:hypothetical protein [Clostridium perfringens]STB61763.1 Uncharacterised protein [Clostridium perfringens]